MNNTTIFYYDKGGSKRGPYPAYCIHYWYTKGCFSPSTTFRIENTDHTLASLLCLNGVSDPFNVSLDQDMQMLEYAVRDLMANEEGEMEQQSFEMSNE